MFAAVYAADGCDVGVLADVGRAFSLASKRTCHARWCSMSMG